MGDPCKLCIAVSKNASNDPFILSLCPRHVSYMVIQRDHTNVPLPLSILAPILTDVLTRASVSALGSSRITVDQCRSKDHNHWHIYSSPPYHLLDRAVANQLVHEAEEAVKLFHPDRYPNFLFEAVWTNLVLTDEDVDRRLRGFQLTMDREIARIVGFGYDGWDWRFQPGWEAKHEEWVRDFKEYAATPEGGYFISEQRVRRYDLLELPREAQRALVSRWQRIWEDNEKAQEYLKRIRNQPSHQVVLAGTTFDVFLIDLESDA